MKARLSLLWGVSFLALFFGLWFLYVEAISIPEVIAAALAAAIAASLLVTLARQGLLDLTFRTFRAGSIWEIPWRALRDAVIVLGGLGQTLLGRRALRGVIVPVRIEPAAAVGDDGPDLFRTWGVSLGSNSIVIGELDGVVLVHQVVPTDAAQLASEVRSL